MAEVYESEQRPRRRGRRWLTVLLVVLVVLLAGLFALDRFSAGYAERVLADRVADEVTAQKARSAKPRVTVEGVPFLTQVLAGSYRDIRIELPEFTGPAGDGRTVSMPLLDIHATDVDAPLDALRGGSGNVVAGAVTGTGTVDYAQLAKLTDQPGLKLTERNGKLIGSAPVQALGQTFDVTATANLTVSGRTIQVRFSDVTAADIPDVPLVRGMIDSYAQRFAVDVRAPELPLGLTVRSLEVRPEGLRFTAGAENVTLRAGGL